ncbi:MAG: hypothetical protein AAGJ70_11850 [Pseudomonadota bacterium]
MPGKHYGVIAVLLFALSAGGHGTALADDKIKDREVLKCKLAMGLSDAACRVLIQNRRKSKGAKPVTVPLTLLPESQVVAPAAAVEPDAGQRALDGLNETLKILRDERRTNEIERGGVVLVE